MATGGSRPDDGREEEPAPRFVWPPRPHPDLTPAPGGLEDKRPPASKPPATVHVQRPARSPELVQPTGSDSAPHPVPGGIGDDATSGHPQSVSSAPGAGGAGGDEGHASGMGAWLAFQRVWLDLVTPPLEQRLGVIGWRADTEGAYCTRCGRTLAAHEPTTARGCERCDRARLPWRRLVRLGAYDEPLTTIVHEIKFTKWRRLGIDAGRLLGEAVKREMQRQGAVLGRAVQQEPIVVPIPTSLRRRLARGIDHTRTLARGLARVCGGDVVQALGRTHRPSQVSLAAHVRATNVAGTMWLRVPPRRLAGRLVIVVDDVTTTGATLRAGTRAIADAFRRSSRATSAGGGGSGGAGKDGGASEGRLEFPVLWVAVLAVTESE